jgi:hypothetical protein
MNTVPAGNRIAPAEGAGSISGTSSVPARDLLIGQWSRSPVRTRLQWFLRTRPGLVGICKETSTLPSCTSDAQCGAQEACVNGQCRLKVKFCLTDTDCTAVSGTCKIGTGQGGRLCMNRPDWRCENDDECAAGLCASASCVSGPSSGFADTAGRSCGAGSDCIPPKDWKDFNGPKASICREPEIRFARNDKGNEFAYELISDPDQNSDLVAAGKLLSGTGSMGETLRNCIEAWKIRKPGDQAPAECGNGYKY